MKLKTRFRELFFSPTHRLCRRYWLRRIDAKRRFDASLHVRQKLNFRYVFLVLLTLHEVCADAAVSLESTGACVDVVCARR